MEEQNIVEDLTCPFCGDTGYDLIGLKMHLSRQWCDAYNNLTILPNTIVVTEFPYIDSVPCPT